MNVHPIVIGLAIATVFVLGTYAAMIGVFHAVHALGLYAGAPA
ncbi:hypothetical protein [Gordonia malaquae]